MATLTPRPRRGERRLYHVTHRHLRASIARAGLCPSCARGSPRVWLAARQRVAWAMSHVAESHGWKITDLIVIVVIVPRSWMHRARRMVYWTEFHVPAVRLSLPVA